MTNRERARSLLQGFSQVFWPKYEGPRAADAPKLLEDAITEALAQAEADALERVLVELRAERDRYYVSLYTRDALNDAIARIEKLRTP